MNTIGTLMGKIHDVTSSEHLTSTVYFLLKSGELKLADIENEILPEVTNIYLEYLDTNIISNSELSVMALSQADERRNVIYRYDFDTDVIPFIYFEKIETGKDIAAFNFKVDSLEQIDAIVTRVGDSQKRIYLFSKIYNVNLIRRDKTLKLFPAGTRFVKFEEQVLKLNGHFEIFLLDGEYYLLKFDLLEKFYKFDEVIKDRAQKELHKVENLSIVESIDYLTANMEDLLFARKFVKIVASSPVIRMDIDNAQIIEFAQNHSKLANRFKYTQDKKKFVLETKQSCKDFLKLLDDDYLHSRLTQIDYETLAKNEM